MCSSNNLRTASTYLACTASTASSLTLPVASSFALSASLVGIGAPNTAVIPTPSSSSPDDTAVFFFALALLFATTTSLGYHVPNLPQKTMTGTFIAASSESLIPAGTFSLE